MVLNTYLSSPALGLDRFLSETYWNHNDKYPHHNIVKVDDVNYRVELALAGFNKEDLTVELKDGKLTIEGKKEEKPDVEYLHQGISLKKFLKTFRLVDTIEIKEAEFTNGVLAIKLHNNLPKEKQPKKVTIKGWLF